MLHVPAAMVVAASPSEDQSKELFRRLTGFYDRVEGVPRALTRNTTELDRRKGRTTGLRRRLTQIAFKLRVRVRKGEAL